MTVVPQFHPAEPVRPGGQICLIGAGPGAADLLTLRAMRRLAAADVVFYDRLVDDDVLDLIPAGAERVFVGKVVGAHAIPQGQINQMIVAAAMRGRRVVRLKSGDPGVFGRAGEEIAAAEDLGIPLEIVPGVTAACAAAAALGRSLTERGVSDTLVLTTGTAAEEQGLPDVVASARPGVTLAIYMGARNVGRITSGLMAVGMPRGTRVDLAVDVSKPGARSYAATLAETTETVQRHGIRGGLMMLVTWPADAQAATQPAAVGHAAP